MAVIFVPFIKDFDYVGRYNTTYNANN